jgi:hypothetical protein
LPGENPQNEERGDEMLYQEIARIRVEEARQYCAKENMHRRSLKEKAKNTGTMRVRGLLQAFSALFSKWVEQPRQKAGFQPESGAGKMI